MFRGLLKVVALAIPVFFLAGLFLMAVMRWRETAQQTRCREHMRQLTLMGLWHFGDDASGIHRQPGRGNGVSPSPAERMNQGVHTFPAGTVVNPSLLPERRLSWQVAILPYLGQDEAYRRFDLSAAWDADINRDAIRIRLPVFSCPSTYRRPAENECQSGSYIGSGGLGIDGPTLPPAHPRAGFFRYDEGTKSDAFQRGLSYTVAILETERERGPWAAGARPTLRGLDVDETPYFGPGRQFGGHPAGGHAAFADGSVRFQFTSDSAKILQRLIPLADAVEP
ncbi:MAG: DUF1559 domain-containing protein [Gemmataceae bacterium]|nr:DUF1559 domain-containing protein [Gemmataceae bacterium]